MKNRKKYYIEKKEVTYGGQVHYEYAITHEGETHPVFYNITEEEANAKLDKMQNHTFYLSDYDNDEIREFGKKIQFHKILDRVRKMFGLNLNFEWPKIKEDRLGCPRNIEIKGTDDLTKLNDAFAILFKSAYIETFNGSISCNRETGKLFAWGNLSLRFEVYDGGRNGINLLDFWYDEENGMKITTNKELYLANMKYEEEE